jgi:hypothetical protein
MPQPKKTPKSATGTGTDPLGRYPEGVPYDPADPSIADAIERGYVVVSDEPAPTEPTVHVPEPDPSGAIRTDRPFTPQEAAAMDTVNRQNHVRRRAERFLTRQGRR